MQSQVVFHKPKSKIATLLGRALFVLFLALGANYVSHLTPVHADSGAKFSVVMNENRYQIGKNKSYFDLKMQPGAKTKVAVTILNQSKKTGHFTVSANRALTNDNMIIDYADDSSNKRPGLSSDLDFNNLVSPQAKAVTVKGHSSKRVSFNLRMPNQQFDGNLLGGIYVRKNVEQRVLNGYTNRFNFITTILMHQNTQKVKPNFELNTVKLATHGLAANVSAQMMNNQPAYVTDIATTGKVYPAGRPDKIIAKSVQTQRSAAPNTNFHYLLPTSLNKMKPGKYVLDLKFVSRTNHKTWHWVKTFTVTKADADQTSQIIHQKHQTMPWWLWLIIALLILIILLLLFLLFKRRKKDDDDDNNDDNNQDHTNTPEPASSDSNQA